MNKDIYHKPVIQFLQPFHFPSIFTYYSRRHISQLILNPKELILHHEIPFQTTW